jgi:AcrR family transcriptional regulator
VTSGSRREQRALQTRDEILTAARRRFAESGYAATTIRDVAAAAGVSVQTVYDSIGSKAALVRLLNDRLDEEADVGSIAAGLATAERPGDAVSIPGRITRRLVERCGDVVAVVLGGAGTSPELAEIAADGARRHRAGATAVAGRLEAFGALRAGLTAAEAAVTIAALADLRLALALRDELGLDGLEAWIVETTAHAVLTPRAAAAALRRTARGS